MWKLSCQSCGTAITVEPSSVHNKLYCSCGVVLLEHVATPEPKESQESIFAAIWREIHTHKLTDPATDLAWLQSITDRLPCGECKQNWPKHLQDNPPPLNDQDAYFEWTWRTHRDHGGDGISLDEAREIWGED